MLVWARHLIKGVTLEEVLFCCETTGGYDRSLCDYIYAKDLDIWRESALQIKRSMGVRKGKDDKADSLMIAEYAMRHMDKAVIYETPNDNVRELKELYRMSLSLKDELVATKNHLENQDTFPKFFADLWKKRAKDLGNDVKLVENRMKEIILADPDLKLKFELLIKVPGIGEGTATAVLAEVTRLENFRTARELAAFIGLTPKHRTSGSSIRGRPRISKMGLRILRKALYLPALTAIKHHPSLKNFAEKLRERGKKFKQIICAIMRKLVHIIFGVLKYDVQKFNAEG
jgi:transposase